MMETKNEKSFFYFLFIFSNKTNKHFFIKIHHVSTLNILALLSISKRKKINIKYIHLYLHI